MGLKATFEKQGGMKLLKQYARSGVLFTAVSQFLLLGKSRTALEILRLSTQLKTTNRLKREYRKTLERFDAEYDTGLPHEGSDIVWICWLQGMENAPNLVQKCWQSVKENLTDREVILVTSENMDQYVQFPDYIIEKWRAGVISHTHLTDLLRLELLIRYGGMWMDATVFCSEKAENIPDYFFKSELFMYQSLKPGRDGHSHINSSWLISAKTNNRILMAVRCLCYEYWKTHDHMINYFLLHEFMAMVAEYYPKEWRAIPPRDNATPHILLLRLFDEYDDDLWRVIKAQTPFHKLTYKFKKEDTEKEGTYYKALFC